jgi:RNA polymerase sigma factor (sigma-70 family)
MMAEDRLTRNKTLRRLRNVSMVLLLNVPNGFHASTGLTTCQAFSSSTLPSFQNTELVFKQRNRKSMRRQQRQQRGSIVCHIFSQQNMMDSTPDEDGYFDLSDTELLEHSRRYRSQILQLAAKDTARIEELREEIKLIRNVLMERHMGLVGYVANAYRNRVQNLTYEDLIQEGMIGLAKAYEKYNPKKNTKFSSYATFWIRARISRVISERDNLVRVPEHVTRAISKINSIPSMQLRSDVISTTSKQDEKDLKDLAVQAGLTEKQLKLALQVSERRKGGGYVAFEPWMTGKQHTLTVSNQQASESLKADSDRDQLKNALSKFLRPKEMEALSWRYGLLECNQEQPKIGNRQFRDYEAEIEEDLFGSEGILKMVDINSKAIRKRTKQIPQIKGKGRWGEAMSFKEVGSQMAVSAEYGRRLCSQALKKLQRAAEEGLLEPALLM